MVKNDYIIENKTVIGISQPTKPFTLLLGLSMWLFSLYLPFSIFNWQT